MDVPEIDVTTLAGLCDQGAVVLDVRTSEEYVGAHVPGAVLVPLGELTERIDEVPDVGGAPLYVICAVGSRSQRAAQLLRAQGVDAVNVAGGTKAWIDAGHHVATGDEPG